jgi:hypothetical protein
VSEIGGWCNNTIERDIQISINHAAGENKLNLFCFTNIGTPNLKFFDWMEGGGTIGVNVERPRIFIIFPTNRFHLVRSRFEKKNTKIKIQNLMDWTVITISVV